MTARCRSCGADIIWARNAETGRWMPIDAAPDPAGTVAVANTRAHVLVAGEDVGRDEARYMTHFATCPNADQHRKGSP